MAERQFSGLPVDAQRRLLGPIRALADSTRPPGAKKLQAYGKAWRIRVGAFRVVYEVVEDTKLVLILKVVRHNERTYRR